MKRGGATSCSSSPTSHFSDPWPIFIPMAGRLGGIHHSKQQRPPYDPSIRTNRLPLFCSIAFCSYLARFLKLYNAANCKPATQGSLTTCGVAPAALGLLPKLIDTRSPSAPSPSPVGRLQSRWRVAIGAPPPTHLGPFLAPPKGGATLPATLQKLKGCMYLFLRNLKGCR